MNLHWSHKKYSVKVAEIDEQHKKLFGFINKMDLLIKENRDKEAVEELLDDMTDYAHYHFDTEEKYFDKFKYPDSKEHKAQHDSYEDKVTYFKDKLTEMDDKDVLKFMYEILDFLQDWWIGHILHEDMKYAEFFNEHGLH